ncbi:hypothetical protein Tco_0824348 [Tanacetum coccineum]|uniref:Retrotransposon Copia-like N-terminal domain-containing protein n=1 Tax=Tanacetum coccineum TaxID=301880 RepID=A0ABQ5AQ45_9ASTR
MMGLNMLIDIVIPDYNALCPIKAKSCTCWQLSYADYLLSLPFLMAAAAQNTNNATIRLILLAEKLTGPNFTNWYQNLRIVLRYEGKLAHLEQPLIPLPYPVASQAARDAYNTLYDTQIRCSLMIGMKAFHTCKQEDGQSVRSYLLKRKSYLDTLEHLGYAMPNKHGVSLILNSLNKDYDQFVQNYNMHSMGKTIAELHVMLKLHEKGIPKKAETPIVLAIQRDKINE